MKTTSIVLPLAALLASISCRDATGPDARGRVDLSVAGPAVAAAAGVSRPVLTGNGHTLDLSAADLTVRDIRLDRVDGRHGEDSDSDGRHSDDVVFRTGPLTLELPLDGRVVTPLGVAVPFGSYDQLQTKLEYLRLRGTYDGQPFDVTIAVDRRLRLELDPPLVVDADHRDANVTLEADISHCFRDATGTPIDPRRLQTDPVLRAAVRECIVRTLRAHEDHDRDGDDEDSDTDSDTDD